MKYNPKSGFQKGHGRIADNRGSFGTKKSQESRLNFSKYAKEHKFGKWMIGKKVSLETLQKMSLSHKGINVGEKNASKRLEVRKKISEALKGKKLSLEHCLKLKQVQEIAFNRILDEVKLLEQQGFRCVPIGRVIPDIIAVKDNKIYAFEVERGTPNYSKYNKGDYGKYFDDINWIIRKRI